jgi:hypothetical protein
MAVARLYHSVVAITIIYRLPPPPPLLPSSGGGQQKDMLRIFIIFQPSVFRNH